MGRIPVALHQRWRHKPSGDERIIFAIVPYEKASGGYPPPEHSGITHVACLKRDDGRRDRRDSSDMELHVEGREAYPAFPSSWEFVRSMIPSHPFGEGKEEK